MDRPALAAWYRDTVQPAMAADPAVERDPETEPPKYRWINGKHPGFVKRLQREWGLSVGEFHATHIHPRRSERTDEGLNNGSGGDESRTTSDSERDSVERLVAEFEDAGTTASDYDWGLPETAAAAETRTRLDRFIDDLGADDAATTVRPIRSRLKLYVRLYRELHDRDDLISPLRDRDGRAAEIDRVLDTCRLLRRAMGTERSAKKYVKDVRWWYTAMYENEYIDYNPTSRILKRLDFEDLDPDNPPLAPDDVRALYHVADTTEERLLVIGLSGWGLRPSELAALSTDQLVLDPTDDGVPYIEFDEERKNGPGTVSMLYGEVVVETRIAEVADQTPWSGHLFPSDVDGVDHIHVDTLRRRFADLVERADIEVNGVPPTPKYGRRFWYTAYTDASAAIAERVGIVGEEQGSADVDVILDNYLSEAKRREYVREEMRERLSGVFGESNTPT